MFGPVSVPRRGFRSLLRPREESVKNDRDLVSVPRRGFRSLLPVGGQGERARKAKFQSPEGDSGLCYQPLREKLAPVVISFSPPKGIQVFATCLDLAQSRVPTRFSPPKGIQVFATCFWDRLDGVGAKFQSPEGDSGLCYLDTRLVKKDMGKVSVPRRGFRSLLLEMRWTREIVGGGFSPPKGIQVFAT